MKPHTFVALGPLLDGDLPTVVCTECGWRGLHPHVRPPMAQAQKDALRAQMGFDHEDCEDVARAQREGLPGMERRRERFD